MPEGVDVETIFVVCFALIVIGIVFVWRRASKGAASRLRLGEGLSETSLERERLDELFANQRPVVRVRWAHWLLAVVVAAFSYFFVGVRPTFAVLFGLIVGVVGSIFAGQFDTRRIVRLETQLADALDLVIAALKAGAGVLEAFESATRESRPPIRQHLERLTGQIRLGDEPRAVFHDFATRVPVETVRLFALALSVHWEVGGNLVPTLSTIARTIRDRVETGRRVGTQSAQARLSLIGVLVITYGLGVVLWQADPARMDEFVGTTVGGVLIALAMLLQLVGIGWMVRLSRIRY